MRLLLDQNIPYLAAAKLRSMGHEAIHAVEIGFSFEPDSAYVSLGIAEDRVIVTFDADFHAILARTNHSRPSVIRIRIQNADEQQVAHLVDKLCWQYERPLLDGCALSTDGESHRMRMLPLRPS